MIEGKGETTHTPEVPPPELELRLAKEMLGKSGLDRTSVQREYDIVFIWFGFLDTVGHLAPVADAGWQERAYRMAAAATDEIRTLLQPEDTLVCLSDHGLQDGHHTEHAFFGSNDEGVVEEVSSVLDVRASLEKVTPSSGAISGYPDIREAYATTMGGKGTSAEEMRDHLRDMGYIE